MKIRAVLDTSALIGSYRHELVYLAEQGHYKLIWSSFLIAEVVRIRMELAFKHRQDRERYRMGINRLIAEISRFASFVDYTRLQGGSYTNWLKDPDDEPLLATALVGKAQYVVSLNTRDFPPGGIFAGVHYVRPTEFISIVATQYPRKKLREAFETSGYRLP